MPTVVVGVLFAALLVVVMTLGSHSAVADPDGPVPNPGHAWTSVQGHGDDADGVYVSTQNDEAFEVRVNGSRALRLEPNADSPNIVGGYSGNSATSGVDGGTISGGGRSGQINQVTVDYATVGGGRANTASSYDATVGGGYGNTASGYNATVGGGYGNDAGANNATVCGGDSNLVHDNYGTVGGGNNQAGDSTTALGTEETYATVGGGLDNTAKSRLATVGGGGANTASGNRATVGGGDTNVASGNRATIGGGDSNLVSDDYGAVGGGGNNRAGDAAGETYDAPYNTVSGGEQNVANASVDFDPSPSGDWEGHATVGGGYGNTASGVYATLSGGGGNVASGNRATVGGGGSNDASGMVSTVGGGDSNLVHDNYGTVCGGRNNQAGDSTTPLGTEETYATVGGGRGNEAAADYATIAGGGPSDPGNPSTTNNVVTDDYGTIGGGGNNQAGDSTTPLGTEETYATVGGGYNNAASDTYATVGGGYNNAASDTYATVGGGVQNKASGTKSTVGGGMDNIASDTYATIAGGYSNDASGYYATIGGGMDNDAIGYYATTGGGYSNEAIGEYTTVPGGYDNTASGDYSFAAGRHANAYANGCFVWGDSSVTAVNCTINDGFMVQANGGLEFYSISDLSTWAKLTAGSNAWTYSSSADIKENFTPVDGQEVLASVAAMPITTWNMKAQDHSIRHMGPVAQDFNAAFGLGDDELGIGSSDIDGVALAAIKGLYELSQEQAERIDDLEARVTALETGAPVVREAAAEAGSESLLSSMMPTGWLLLAGLFVLGGLVVVQRRLAGGR